jgi:hypothetical protein
MLPFSNPITPIDARFGAFQLLAISVQSYFSTISSLLLIKFFYVF